jgi:hypothetical protein
MILESAFLQWKGALSVHADPICIIQTNPPIIANVLFFIILPVHVVVFVFCSFYPKERAPKVELWKKLKTLQRLCDYGL